MDDASAQIMEKPNYTLRDQDMERWRERDRYFYLYLDLNKLGNPKNNTGQYGSYHHIHTVYQHSFNGMLSHQIQQILHAQNFPSRLFPVGILVSITARQGGPLHWGDTPGVGWVGVLLLILTLQYTV